MHLHMIQTLLGGLAIALGALLLIGLLLLLLLHVTRAVDSRRVQRMREQLLCLISGAAEAKRMKNHIYEMVNPEGKLDQLCDIRGIRTTRGLIVMAETAGELSGATFEKLQKEVANNMKKAKEELAQTEVHAEAGGGLVKVTMTGRYIVKRIEINPELLQDEPDMIEDLIAAAVNDAVRQAEVVSEEKMQKANSGMGLPPGLAGMF